MTDKLINIKCENGYAEIVTPKIEGELNALIINSPTKNQVQIISGLGYVIFDSKECEGIQYIPLSIQSIDPTGKRINFSSTKFQLNEKLIIKINQVMKSNETIKIILRLE